MSQSSPLIADRYSIEEITSAIVASGGPPLVVTGRIPGGASAGAWHATDDSGRTLVLKVLIGEDHQERVRFQATHLPTLAARGLPVPRIKEWGLLDDSDATYLVYSFVPGSTAETIDESLLAQILELVELQAEARTGSPKRDWSPWMHGVLFEDWADWWPLVSETSSEGALLCEQIRAWVDASKGLVLPSPDFIHGNFHQGQVLVEDGRITGIVDWDHLAIGSRAIDLGSLLVAWYVLRRLEVPDLAQDGNRILMERVHSLTGEAGLRQITGYHVLAGCWFWRRDRNRFPVWVDAGLGLLAELSEYSYDA